MSPPKAEFTVFTDSVPSRDSVRVVAVRENLLPGRRSTRSGSLPSGVLARERRGASFRAFSCTRVTTS
jgi:hypothetical protein